MSTANALQITLDGSQGLDVQSIVSSLISADSAPVTQMQTEVSNLQSEVSAYQSLNTQLSTLSNDVNTALYGSTVAPLDAPYDFEDRLAESVFSQSTVTSSNSSVVTATSSNATPGSYAITVSSLAQAQADVSSGFSSSTSNSVGTGTLVITTGSNSPVTVTINSTNNTLSGVCQAINAANAGVTATVVNNGSSSPYEILLTASNSGTANGFQVAENLSGGQALGFTQVQQAANANFTINNVAITRSSNTISDVINGVTFTLGGLASSNSPVTLDIATDTSAIVSAIQNIVTDYNAVNTFINNQFSYNTTTDTAGVLSGDSTLRNIESMLQSTLTQTVSNPYTSYTSAAQVGLTFNQDGSLALNTATLQSALESDPQAVAALFLGNGTPPDSGTATDSRVTYNGDTANTQPGTYAIQVTGLAAQASVTGSQTITSLTNGETLTITSGTASPVPVQLHQGDSLTTVLSEINSALTQAGVAATATDNGTGELEISTNGYGSSQSLTVTSTADGTSGSSGFSGTAATATGTDIQGTINGDAAVGNGLTLTGASGQPESGLSVTIAQSGTGSYGSVTVTSSSQGDEGTSVLTALQSALSGITNPLSGPIQYATNSLNQNITDLNTQISAYQARLNTESNMLTQEYDQANEALQMMSVTKSALTEQIATLSSSSS